MLSLGIKTNNFITKKALCVGSWAGHGTWCWYKIITLLQSYGYNVTVFDLTTSGINPRQIIDLNFSSVLDYVLQPLIDFMASLKPKERVILVGHSLARLGMSVAIERFSKKISAVLFVTAFMPGPNLTYITIAEDAKFINVVAFKIIVTFNFPLFTAEALVLKQTKLTKGKNGSVHRVFIVCDQDLAIDDGLQRWMIERNPPTEVNVINGIDHMVMFTRPLKLFSYLGQIAEKYD
ncbi:hypothetical protein TIFTF001_002593 [Ficus carica]|uniref:AB hydrolase-1 domain-containing protein n=1 Tax=Ficus carica TaxID=3494 RepID=A0AA87ZNP2_FICCA|nr:hypothetical protein TIFTF001_002593 [Ficus carica]